MKSSTVEAAIKKYNNKNVLWSSQGMLRLLPEAMDKLFQPTIDAIVKAVREVINQPDVQGLLFNNILVVMTKGSKNEIVLNSLKFISKIS